VPGLGLCHKLSMLWFSFVAWNNAGENFSMERLGTVRPISGNLCPSNVKVLLRKLLFTWSLLTSTSTITSDGQSNLTRGRIAPAHESLDRWRYVNCIVIVVVHGRRLSVDYSAISDVLEWPSVSFTYCKHLKCGFSYSCVAVDKISTDLEHRAVSLR